MSENAADKLVRARCRLMTREPFYGHMAMSIEWKESEMPWQDDPKKRTMGIRITSDNIIQAYYHPDWIMNTSLEQIFGAIEHSINHLIRLHTVRTGGRDKDAWGLATDATVNGKRSKPLIGYEQPDKPKILPNDNMFFMPEQWADGESAEYYYELLKKEQEEQEDQNNGGEGEEGEEGEGEDEEGAEGQGSGAGNGKYEFGEYSGEVVDDHEIWESTDASSDNMRQVIADMTNDAIDKSQGNVPGHLKEIIENLNKPIVRWRELLRSYLGRYVGGNRKTFSRANRRYDSFGIKGVSHHAASTVSIVVDTSGSIGSKELEQFFAEIEAISYRAKVFVLQWDHAYQGYDRYRKGDWRKLTVNGRGGTDMAAPVDWLEKNGLMGNVIVMLTDGYCNYPHPRSIPFICVITTDESQTHSPEWGNTVRLKVHE